MAVAPAIASANSMEEKEQGKREGSGAAAEPSDEGAVASDQDWEPVQGDLASGSASHRLNAAGSTVVLDYWTDDDPGEWTPESSPIIRLNASIEGPGDGRAMKVTRFNVRADGLGIELANDTGEFMIAPPFSYTSGIVIPANPDARSTRVIVTFDLLTETYPGSLQYTRQTILDTITIGYAKPRPEIGG